MNVCCCNNLQVIIFTIYTHTYIRVVLTLNGIINRIFFHQPIMEEESNESRSVSSRPLIMKQDQSHRRQPSLDNDSSGTGSGDEEQTDRGQQKENKRYNILGLL